MVICTSKLSIHPSVYLSICICPYIYLIGTYVCLSMCLSTCLFIYICMCIYLYIHTYIYICMYIHMVHMYMHACTYVRFLYACTYDVVQPIQVRFLQGRLAEGAGCLYVRSLIITPRFRSASAKPCARTHKHTPAPPNFNSASIARYVSLHMILSKMLISSDTRLYMYMYMYIYICVYIYNMYIDSYTEHRQGPRCNDGRPNPCGRCFSFNFLVVCCRTAVSPFLR